MSLSDFIIGKELGKGAYSSVYIVQRKADGNTYAMKRVNISKLTHKEKENALNEIRILASLSNNNIIEYKEAFFDEDSKTLNIVMEYADDGDLLSKIKFNIKYHLAFKEETIWDYLIQVLNGLQYLHSNNIMHRDLKSANLFIMKKNEVKIGDLNVSKIALTGMASTQTGTPYYASPEIWKDKPYDYTSDIWSVGCIIYEMCKLRPPFRGTSLIDLCEKIQKGVYDNIPNMYSKELRKVIGMMLVVNPVNRATVDYLLKCNEIQMKIKENHNCNLNGIGKANMIKTIKMPRNLNEINSALPKQRYHQQREEMFENDAYESKKKGFFDGEETLFGKEKSTNITIEKEINENHKNAQIFINDFKKRYKGKYHNHQNRSVDYKVNNPRSSCINNQAYDNYKQNKANVIIRRINYDKKTQFNKNISNNNMQNKKKNMSNERDIKLYFNNRVNNPLRRENDKSQARNYSPIGKSKGKQRPMSCAINPRTKPVNGQRYYLIKNNSINISVQNKSPNPVKPINSEKKQYRPTSVNVNHKKTASSSPSMLYKKVDHSKPAINQYSNNEYDKQAKKNYYNYKLKYSEQHKTKIDIERVNFYPMFYNKKK